MKDLHRFIWECQRDLDSLAIPYRKVVKWEINTRAKCRWGLCRQVGPGEFVISIASVLLEDTVSDQALKDTIIHELIHTVYGCMNHGKRWKLYADLVNRKLPQYQIRRTTSREEKGISTPEREPVYRFVLQCSQCGAKFYRERESKLVQHPEKYRCGKCMGRLNRIQ